MKNIIQGAIPTLLDMLSDTSVQVRGTVAWCIRKICEFHSDCLTNEILLDTLIQTIIKNLKSHRKVVVQLCDALHYLAMNLSTLLTKYSEVLLNELLTISFMKDAYNHDNNVALVCFFTIGSLIDYSSPTNPEVMNNFFTGIVNAFASSLDIKNFQNEEIQYAYQSYIATVISACLIDSKAKINKEQAKYIFQLIKESFTSRNNIYEEGLMACSSLSLSLGQDFLEIFKDFGSYLIHGLSQWEDVSVCRTAINCTSDLIRSLGQTMNPFIDQIIPKIIFIIEHMNSDKHLKTQAFLVITDMFVCLREKALTYYEQLMSIIKNALTAAVFVPQTEDLDLIEYLKNLRSHLLECITCVIYCLKDTHNEQMFVPYVLPILNFIHQIVGNQYDPSLEIYADALGIIGDLCTIYTSKMKGAVNMNVVQNMIIRLNNGENSRKYEQLVTWTQQVLREINAKQ